MSDQNITNQISSKNENLQQRRNLKLKLKKIKKTPDVVDTPSYGSIQTGDCIDSIGNSSFKYIGSGLIKRSFIERKGNFSNFQDTPSMNQSLSAGRLVQTTTPLSDMDLQNQLPRRFNSIPLQIQCNDKQSNSSDFSHCNICIEPQENASASEIKIHNLLDQLEVFKINVSGFIEEKQKVKSDEITKAFAEKASRQSTQFDGISSNASIPSFLLKRMRNQNQNQLSLTRSVKSNQQNSEDIDISHANSSIHTLRLAPNMSKSEAKQIENMDACSYNRESYSPLTLLDQSATFINPSTDVSYQFDDCSPEPRFNKKRKLDMICEGIQDICEKEKIDEKVQLSDIQMQNNLQNLFCGRQINSKVFPYIPQKKVFEPPVPVKDTEVTVRQNEQTEKTHKYLKRNRLQNGNR